MRLILFVLIALVLLLLVSGGAMFYLGCVRQKEQPWLQEDKIKQTPYGKYYPAIRMADAWLREHNAQPLSIQSHDGLLLYGRWIPAENPRGTVLLAHGYRSTCLIDFAAFLEFYHTLGMNILLPDQRSHGKSQGRYITFGVKESADMAAWIEAHNHRFGDFPMFLMGISMGASTVLYLADQKLPANVRGIIADCGFTSPAQILGTVYRRMIHLPAGPTLWTAAIFARLFAGFSLWEKDTRKSLSHARLPVLMIHGREDGFVPCAMTEAGYAACRGNKQLLLVDGADHGLSILRDPEGYCNLLEQFIGNFSDPSV